MTAQASSVPPRSQVQWPKTYRLIPSRYPPIDLFERIADPSDGELLAQIEGLTNDRLRDQIGQISVVPIEERLSGPGATVIMAVFTHIGHPSRFTDGSFGVYYASDSLEGALAEVLYHQEQFLKRTSEPKTHVDLRMYVGRIDSELFDVRSGWQEVHDPNSYERSQQLAKQLRALGANGIVFRSVRRPDSSNLAVFRPSILAASAGKAHVVEGGHLRVEWDGTRMSRYIVMGESTWNVLQ